MSLPPDDENPEEIKDLFHDLSTELENAGFIDNDIRDELLTGIQDSIRALFGEMNIEPQVTVVDGGRTDETPPTDTQKPDLRVASFDDVENNKSDETVSYDASNISVRVLRPKNVFSTLLESSTEPKNNISLPGNIHVLRKGDEQKLYLGQTPRTYRLDILEGTVQVLERENILAEINASQSIDIEGTSISIRSVSGVVRGRYQMIEPE